MQHLLLDGYGGKKDLLGDPDLIHRWLADFPATIGMRILGEPSVVWDHLGEAGWSGFAVITTSHLCVHTFPEKCTAWVDVFSCRPFDHAVAIQAIIKLFEFNNISTQLVARAFAPGLQP